MSDKMSKEEMEKRIADMQKERRKQDAEIIRKYSGSGLFGSTQKIEKPFSKEEIEKRIADMQKERRKQDGEIMMKYGVTDFKNSI